MIDASSCTHRHRHTHTRTYLLYIYIYIYIYIYMFLYFLSLSLSHMLTYSQYIFSLVCRSRSPCQLLTLAVFAIIAMTTIISFLFIPFDSQTASISVSTLTSTSTSETYDIVINWTSECVVGDLVNALNVSERSLSNIYVLDDVHGDKQLVR